MMLPLYAVIALGLALATLHTASQTFARQKAARETEVRRVEPQIGPAPSNRFTALRKG